MVSSAKPEIICGFPAALDCSFISAEGGRLCALAPSRKDQIYFSIEITYSMYRFI